MIWLRFGNSGSINSDPESAKLQNHCLKPSSSALFDTQATVRSFGVGSRNRSGGGCGTAWYSKWLGNNLFGA